MEISSIVDNIIQLAKHKYKVASDKAAPDFRQPLSSGHWQKTILTLYRATQTPAYAKTVLVASGAADAALEDVYRWCAYVKGNLLDPGTADLYLFLVYVDPVPELDVCLQVEADELFCRKYVLRPQESLEDLFNRSFLSEPSTVNAGGERAEPLKRALMETSRSFPWLDDTEIAYWRNILLTDGSGIELARQLYQRSTYNQ